MVALAAVILPCHSADSDPLQDYCVADLTLNLTINGYPCKDYYAATIDDFVFSLATPANTSNAYGADSFPGIVQTFPGLNTLGFAILRLDFAVGGLIPPHTHPLASELVYVEEGSLYAGFVTQDNRLFAKILNKGDVLVIPRALIHWQLNVGDTPAKAIATLNSQQNPGAQLIASSLFGSGIRDDVLAKTFFLDESIVRHLKSNFS
ncbi:germin-like protein subfamily T member 2 [Selaginella moellendorffii]|uniref:germin-like protein subfamily T member 2 n=1 Tax=Selaginella moellendorffii TaxID=88036 RepID=UPI000D1C38E6|nr:germin-like protein subfamily T member 2 [Selaginella moellendorffii]|eukprot:XP_024516026.1 germin-like protein subfamily T member 2 [Selaginella moellendorffii]